MLLCLFKIIFVFCRCTVLQLVKRSFWHERVKVMCFCIVDAFWWLRAVSPFQTHQLAWRPSHVLGHGAAHRRRRGHCTLVWLESLHWWGTATFFHGGVREISTWILQQNLCRLPCLIWHSLTPPPPPPTPPVKLAHPLSIPFYCFWKFRISNW